MFKKIYFSTFKEIFSNPASLISIIAFGVLFILLPTRNRIGENGIMVEEYSATITLWVTNAMVFAIIVSAIVFAVSMLYDVRNKFYDIERATLMNQRMYYFSKISAYFSYAFLVVLFFSFINVIVTYFNSNAFINFNYPVYSAETLIRLAAAFVLVVIPGCITAVCIPVSLAIITKSKAVGIIAGVIYMILSFILQSPKYYILNYIFVPSNVVRNFLIFSLPNGDLSKLFHFNKDVNISLLLVFSVDLLLFLISYVLFARRENKV